MTMDNTTYTISELEKITGLNRRTIHFYTKERVIPPPSGAGGAAKYGEEHVLRLRLIGEMQKSHLKLSGIREALDAMSIEEMRSLSEKIESAPHQVWDRDALESWMNASKNMVSSLDDSLFEPVPPFGANKSFSFLKIGKEKQTNQPREDDRYLQNLRRSQNVREASWQRFEVVDGVEINVRSDALRRHRQLIIRLIEEMKRNI